MKHYNIYLFFVIALLVGCVSPTKVNTADLDTVNKKLAYSIAELDGLVTTVENLKATGVIIVGTPRHASIKKLLSDGLNAIEAASNAIKLGDLATAESKQAVLTQTLLLLRKELAQ